MKYVLWIVALFTFIFISCDTSQSPTQSQDNSRTMLKATQVKDFELPFQITNTCCNDVITGILYEHGVINNNGIHFNTSGIKGTGLNGDTYTGNTHLLMSSNSNDNNGQEVSTQVYELTLTSPNGCKIRVHVTLHTTWNADGTVTAEVEHISTECFEGF
jgi:hypothetical protein